MSSLGINWDEFIQNLLEKEAKEVGIPDPPKGPGEVTPQDIRTYPVYYIQGPGRGAASQTSCPCGNRSLVDSGCVCYDRD